MQRVSFFKRTIQVLGAMSYRLQPFHSSDSAILDPVCSELNFPTPLFKYKHKLVDEERWTAVIWSNPKRVVNALGLYSSADATNQWGDTIAVTSLSSITMLYKVKVTDRYLLGCAPSYTSG